MYYISLFDSSIPPYGVDPFYRSLEDLSTWPQDFYEPTITPDSMDGRMQHP